MEVYTLYLNRNLVETFLHVCVIVLKCNLIGFQGINRATTELIQNLSGRFLTMVKEDLANRPDNTAFTQQRLPAWQPMLSAGIVIPGFLVIGLAFIGIGVALFVTSQSIQVLEVWLRMRRTATRLRLALTFHLTDFSPWTDNPLFKEVWCLFQSEGRGVAAFNNSGLCSILTSWNTRGNSRPPPATSALIPLSRTACAMWNSPLQPSSRLDPNTRGIFSRGQDPLTFPFLPTGTRVLLLWSFKLLPELQEIWCVQRRWAALWRLG